MLAASVKQSDGMHNLECIMGQERSGGKFERMEGRNDEDLSQRNSGRYNPKALLSHICRSMLLLAEVFPGNLVRPQCLC